MNDLYVRHQTLNLLTKIGERHKKIVMEEDILDQTLKA
jgi:hypothetical protein